MFLHGWSDSAMFSCASLQRCRLPVIKLPHYWPKNSACLSNNSLAAAHRWSCDSCVTCQLTSLSARRALFVQVPVFLCSCMCKHEHVFMSECSSTPCVGKRGTTPSLWTQLPPSLGGGERIMGLSCELHRSSSQSYLQPFC